MTVEPGSRSGTAPSAAPVDIRPLQGRHELEQCVELQRTTWGPTFDQLVPATILWVAQRTGGIASGAFAADGTLLGFVFGISGVENGSLIHWSDMLAVRPEARGRGLGVALKLHQREMLLARGIERVYWTFDPLEARNAHINFQRLGIVAREYLRDVYGDTGSELHAVIGTDRLLAVWDLTSPRVIARVGGAPVPATTPAAHPVTGESSVRIEVPLDIQRLKREAPERAVEWRRITRAAFERYLGEGAMVVDVVRTGDTMHYILEPPRS